MKAREELLKDFKKSNKTRRLYLANKHGYKTVEEYLSYLTNVLPNEIKENEVKLVEVKDDSNSLNVVIAFDTTGSMNPYIERVKQVVLDLLPKLFDKTSNLLISIVAFGDYYDASSKDNLGDAYQVINLTNNIEDLINFVKNSKKTNGGDIDEFYELVLHKIRTETKWKTNSKKSVLLIGDSYCHRVGYEYKDSRRNLSFKNQLDWVTVAEKLKQDNISVSTVSINSVDWYKKLSSITNGLHLPFFSSEKTDSLLEGYIYSVSNNQKELDKMLVEAESKNDKELINLVKTLKNNNMKKEFKVGEFLSETTYSVIKKVEKDSIVVTSNGKDFTISKEYAETMLNSSTTFSKTEKRTKTELADIVLNNPKTAMTILYNTKLDINEVAKELAYKSLSESEIKSKLEGKERLIEGYHNGNTNDDGRLNFIDVKIEKDSTKSYDNRIRQVDLRSIKYVIVNHVKFELK